MSEPQDSQKGLSISIQSVKREKDNKNKDYIVYDILIRENSDEWNVPLTYFEILDMHNKLKKEFARYIERVERVSPFPPKEGLFTNVFEPKFIEIRRNLLEKYLKELCKCHNLYCSKYFYNLLKTSGQPIDDAGSNGKDNEDSDEEENLLKKGQIQPNIRKSQQKSSSQMNNSPHMTNSQQWAPIVQLLPLTNLQIPPIIQLKNNEELFVLPIIDHLNDTLRFFSEIERQLFIGRVEERLAILEQWKSRLNGDVNALLEEKEQIIKILNDERVQMNVDLFYYFQMCYGLIDRAIYWEKNVESVVLGQLSGNEVLEEKVKKLESQAQELVLENVLSSSQTAQIKEMLKGILNEAQIEYKQCLLQPETDPYQQRLKALINFITQAMDSKIDESEIIMEFESRMYKLLETGNTLDKKEIQEAFKIRNKILDLIKEISIFKNSLRKKESEQKGHLMNRLEDLQENLADFEHNFSTKFRLKQMTNVQNKEHDDMFAL